MKDIPTNGYAEVNDKNGVEKDKKEEYEEVDAIQEAMGAMGRWQILVCIAISLVKFPVAWHQLAIVFMAPHTQQFNCTSPANMHTSAKDQCIVNVNGSHVECQSWEFDRSIFPETIISQWNLVCNRSHYANIQQSILMFGILLGNITFGSLADRFGRKIPLMISVILQLVSGIGCAIVPWFPALLFLKLLAAMATGGTMVTSYVICMEIVGTKWRAAITVLYQIPFSLGHMSLAGIAYLFRHWQHLQLAISLPSIILLTIFFNWAVCGMGLFGMTQYIGQVGGDIFVNFAVSGATQIPDLAWLRLILACFGIVGMSVSFTTVYLFSGELFPTVVRNIGVGTSSMCARIGSMVAPFVVSLSLVRGFLPPLIFGTFPLIGAVLALFLPETNGCQLPETLQDGEDFGKKIKKSLKVKESEAEIAL
ncbi:Similar to Orct2: Organic cation transporter-like protein (Drosophila melanogaster) [Cotesia congregata]|uniref:Similar to Orct2: Organic cation transporter-like protein (Drosophila melanogaster) n=1 Tax=Cotesia congregata TaxID=51543 RepID=A0A8J2HFJ8_COTCN|nr:Similar to Orct2: Organic cation transporter-like protein (Drosophila melanogaster) [Cotesia congregata]